VIVGYECGGHPGLDEVPIATLIPQVVQAVRIPVIAGGGFVDGKGFISALALGAQGIQMGTRFLLTHECPLHPEVKKTLLLAKSTDTIIIKRSIRKPARVYRNDTAKKVVELENRGAGVNELLPYIGGEAYLKLIEDGDVEAGVIALGQGVGMIDRLKSAKEVIDDIIKEANEVVERLVSLRAAKV
jgi:nitronate monooxygenase